MAKHTSRQVALGKSIQSAFRRDPSTFRVTTWRHLLAFFSIYHAQFLRYAGLLFRMLRNYTWGIDEAEYVEGLSSMTPRPDVRLTGATFHSSDAKYRLKSVPRHFEESLFRRDLLQPYYTYMRSQRYSLLIWITDYIYAPYTTIGSKLRIAPTHYVITENEYHGLHDDPAHEQWETYDFRVTDYSPGAMPMHLMKPLGRPFEDKVRLWRADYEDLMDQARRDMAFLRSVNATDFLLCLVRFPVSWEPPVVGNGSPWRIGVPSFDGKWKYRVFVTDYFWSWPNYHHPTTLPEKSTMPPEEYCDRFLAKMEDIMEVSDFGPTPWS